MRMIAFFLVVLFSLTGCSTKVEEVSAERSDNLDISDENKIFSVYYAEKEWEKSPLETNEGCMSGAYIVEDKIVSGDWKRFEEVTKHSHNIYGYVMRAGEEFPLTWALECFVEGKIPMIALYPRSGNDPYEYESILKTAEEAGAFQIPLFLYFYPNATAYGDGKAYGDFYGKARRAFREKAPNAVFIWGVSAEDGEKALDYYPGDTYVDWIGLDVFEKSGEQGIGVSEQVERWYNTWQKRKPLMISQLAISHYSSKDSRYTEKEVALELERFYESMGAYPRIKAVVYQEGEAFEDGAKMAIRQNYLLTDNDRILEAYTRAISTERWNLDSEKAFEGEMFRSPFLAYETDGHIYLQENTVRFDLGEKVLGEGKIINEKRCIPMNCLNGYEVKREGQNLFLQKVDK